ncbi:hypothetical protein OKW76_09990 [Sphingomonas sp. S1-29]|uniref:hypothetical protein n=1 Tax=Sphingomonas sp. S1-29 TaxID=2991074 RepID=UPI00223F566B|nr:hypothetical protein [Sphingomonas sp. S1-29]UZK68397.1 hypothetical protein OKW76_09990 [Sphingomonas sp. S1-29]
MDLSFARFDRGTIVTAVPGGLAVLLAAAAGRQAGSVTARLQARLALQPVTETAPLRCDAAFNAATAAALARRTGG